MGKYWDRVKLAVNTLTGKAQYIKDFNTGTDLKGNDVDVLKYSAFFGCIRILAETFASTSINEYQKISDTDRQKTDDTGVLDILKYEPNSYMNAYSFNEMSNVQLNTGGNFYALKIFNNAGRVAALKPITYENVELKIEDGEIKYKVGEKIYTRKEMYHVVGFSFDGIQGLSPLTHFSHILKLGMTYDTYSQNLFKNGALNSGVFEMPGYLKDEAYNRLKEDLTKNYIGLINSGKPLLLEDGLKFNPIAISPVDAQLIESKRFQIEDIARVFRVPLHLLQNLERATNNNIEHQSLEFVMYTMLPWFKRYEAAINAQLLTKNQRQKGYYLEYNIASLLRGDSKSMAEAFAVGRQWGWLCVNDIRRLLNMNPIPNGDIYLEPLNMHEAGKPIESKVSNKIVKEIMNLIEESKRGQ